MNIENKKSLSVNVILNIIKQCCAIIFPLITFPYASRILGVENYGKVNFGTSIVNYFTLFAGMGITNYAIREGSRIRDDKRKFNTFANEVFTINVVSSLIVYFLLFSMLFGIERLELYREIILVQSIGIFITTIGTEWVNSVYEEYVYITVRYIVVHILAIVLMFLMVRGKNDYIKYAFITVFGVIGANVINIFYVKKFINLQLVKVKNLKKHLLPMLMLLCNSLSIMIYVNSDIILLGFFSGDKAVGIYSAATKIFNIIKQLLNAIVVVMIPRISALLGKNKFAEYNALLKDTFHLIIFIMLPIITLIGVLSYDIIWIIGGESYAVGYKSLSVLSLALIVAVFANFYNNAILIPNKKEKYFLVSTVTAAIVNIILNLVLIPKLDYVGAAITTVVAEGIVLYSGIFFSKGVCSFKINWKDIISSVIGCLMIVFWVLLVKECVESIILRSLISCVGSGLIYLVVLIILKNSYISLFMERIKKVFFI